METEVCEGDFASVVPEEILLFVEGVLSEADIVSALVGEFAPAAAGVETFAEDLVGACGEMFFVCELLGILAIVGLGVVGFAYLERPAEEMFCEVPFVFDGKSADGESSGLGSKAKSEGESVGLGEVNWDFEGVVPGARGKQEDPS